MKIKSSNTELEYYFLWLLTQDRPPITVVENLRRWHKMQMDEVR